MNGLKQWVLQPTFIISDNILDLILTSEDDRVSDSSLLDPPPGCDHLLLEFIYQFSSVVYSDPVQVKWFKADYAEIGRRLLDIDWDFEFGNLEVEYCYDAFLNPIQRTCGPDGPLL